MLMKGFFLTEPANPWPYSNNVIVNLSGAQKFEEGRIFAPGKYRIELAPGTRYYPHGTLDGQINMSYDETITVPFIIRAYCGSDATATSAGTNPYSGIFKVNQIDARTITQTPQVGIDVTHIFGAGAGNKYWQDGPYLYRDSGGANCLGNGNVESATGSNIDWYGGAGSCLHLLPVGGVFGTDYIRAYHASPTAYCTAGAYGGGGCSGNNSSRGGNSPYGNGATSIDDQNTGIGGGNKRIYEVPGGYKLNSAAGAYFNGSEWIDAPGNVRAYYNNVRAPSSYIRITYLGPLFS